jgi:hypothetical protein
MASWPNVLPLWRIEYSNSYYNAVARTALTGKKTQRQVTQRASEIVNVTLTLYGAELAVFEYFVQNVLNQGQDFFTGSYIADGEVKTGSIRLVGGRYTVSAITGRDWQVSTSIEVNRA